MSIVGSDEKLPVSLQHDIYPRIDPQVHYDGQTYSGKVVLVTGASRGIGREAALQYARAGARLVLVSRDEAALNESKGIILDAAPAADVLTLSADVKDAKRTEEVVRAAIARFGRLDILVANAGTARAMGTPFASNDPSGWWDVVEVHLRGVYNYVHFSVPELLKVKGQIIITTSAAAQMRAPTASEYCIAKHAVGRLAECITVEYPAIKVYTVHPGVVETYLYINSKAPAPVKENASLAASTFLYLTAGNAEFLSGRYIAANWDLGEVEREWKQKILDQNALVSKLFIPM